MGSECGDDPRGFVDVVFVVTVEKSVMGVRGDDDGGGREGERRSEVK